MTRPSGSKLRAGLRRSAAVARDTCQPAEPWVELSLMAGALCACLATLVGLLLSTLVQVPPLVSVALSPCSPPSGPVQASIRSAALYLQIFSSALGLLAFPLAFGFKYLATDWECWGPKPGFHLPALGILLALCAPPWLFGAACSLAVPARCTPAAALPQAPPERTPP